MSQKISGARFAKISQRYAQEQRKHAKRIKALLLELKKRSVLLRIGQWPGDSPNGL
nr:hypothetical protein [uncultured Oscillibacter sp.]